MKTIDTSNLSRAYIHKVMRDYPWKKYKLSPKARAAGERGLARAVWEELRKAERAQE